MNDLLAAVQGSRYFGGPQAPLSLSVSEGHPVLTVITGPNASGKSVFRKVLGTICSDRAILYVNTSFQDRCSASGLKRVMMYGGEEEDSTGYNSVKGFLKALQSSRGYERKHVLFFDEPDLGLADEYCAALGHRLCEFVSSTPEQCLGVFLVTHNRHLVRPLLPQVPSHACLGSPVLSLSQWATREVSAGDLDAMLNSARSTWSKVEQVRKTKT